MVIDVKKFIIVIGAVAGAVILIAIGMAVLLTPASGSLPLPSTVNLTESANDTTIHVHIGDQIHLVLDENPSTGYSWNYTVPQGFSTALDEYTAPSGSPLVGQGGTHTWILTAEQKGTYNLSWIYKRSWESTAADRPFHLTVIVE